MIPSFIALFSKAGIACAADTDHTVFRLSDKYPVAIAVNPDSPIPWESIIEKFKREGEISEHEYFPDYADDFNAYLAGVPVEEKWKDLTAKDTNIIIMGFGSDDIYPSVCDSMVSVNNEGQLEMDTENFTIGDNMPVRFNLLGDFESVSTILWGSTRKFREVYVDGHLELFGKYKARVLEKFAGTKYEQYVKDSIDNYDEEDFIVSQVNNSTESVYHDLAIGIDSFSVQDMVTAVETIVNANVNLSHLREGVKYSIGEVKEIAVLTIPEGLTWIKHSLYAV